MAASDTIEAEGHLIDSGLLSAIFDKIIEFKGAYEILTFDIGTTNDDASRIQMRDHGRRRRRRSTTCSSSSRRSAAIRSASATPLVKPAEKDRCVPDDFYSTTNHRTHVRLERQWVEVDKQRMDAVIVVDGRTRRVPQAARRQGRRAGRVRPRGHPRHARVPASATARLRLHEQRRLVRAPRRRQRRAHRRR